MTAEKVVHITPVQWAEEMAAAEQRGAERALREAADEMLRDAPEHALETRSQMLDRHRRAQWLRDRAALAHPSTDPDG